MSSRLNETKIDKVFTLLNIKTADSFTLNRYNIHDPYIYTSTCAWTKLHWACKICKDYNLYFYSFMRFEDPENEEKFIWQWHAPVGPSAPESFAYWGKKWINVHAYYRKGTLMLAIKRDVLDMDQERAVQQCTRDLRGKRISVWASPRPPPPPHTPSLH